MVWTSPLTASMPMLAIWFSVFEADTTPNPIKAKHNVAFIARDEMDDAFFSPCSIVSSKNTMVNQPKMIEQPRWCWLDYGFWLNQK
mmetsp:Transcript_15974/g.36859  ORF Transcript_15974/g.36859 Transcript_15974/m.36859 type:complete len:86 (-) Transcript_15974:109-366(-)